MLHKSKKFIFISTLSILLFNSRLYSFEEKNNFEKKEKTFNNIYHEKFKDILLVIHFNYPYYANIPFLKELYSPIFKNIVFYGEKKHPEVIDVYSHYGYYMSEVLQDIIKRFPNLNGYMILQDDCLLNFWNLINLDQEKIGYAITFNFTNEIKTEKINSDNPAKWWNRKFENNLTMFDQIKKAYNKLEINDKEILKSNFGENIILGQACDFFYIPKKYYSEIIRLSKSFENVFCETAIPTMLFCLDSIENFEQLKMAWGIGEPLYGIPFITESNYHREQSWIHPVKFSIKNNRDLTKKIFEKEIKNLQ